MICPYCNKQAKLLFDSNQKEYYCNNHQDSVFLRTVSVNNSLEQLELISIRSFVSNIKVCVFLFPLINITEVYLYNKMDPILEVYSASLILQLDSLLAISPDNIHQKLKTLITFS